MAQERLDRLPDPVGLPRRPPARPPPRDLLTRRGCPLRLPPLAAGVAENGRDSEFFRRSPPVWRKNGRLFDAPNENDERRGTAYLPPLAAGVAENGRFSTIRTKTTTPTAYNTRARAVTEAVDPRASILDRWNTRHCRFTTDSPTIRVGLRFEGSLPRGCRPHVGFVTPAAERRRGDGIGPSVGAGTRASHAAEPLRRERSCRPWGRN